MSKRVIIRNVGPGTVHVSSWVAGDGGGCRLAPGQECFVEEERVRLIRGEFIKEIDPDTNEPRRFDLEKHHKAYETKKAKATSVTGK